MTDGKLGRREFMRRAAALGAAAALGPSLLAACTSGGGGDTIRCDTSGLSAAEQQMRQTLNYVDQTPNAAQRCDNCALWVPATSENACGGCELPLGPVHPAGWCSSWAPET